MFTVKIDSRVYDGKIWCDETEIFQCYHVFKKSYPDVFYIIGSDKAGNTVFEADIKKQRQPNDDFPLDIPVTECVVIENMEGKTTEIIRCKTIVS